MAKRSTFGRPIFWFRCDVTWMAGRIGATAEALCLGVRYDPRTDGVDALDVGRLCRLGERLRDMPGVLVHLRAVSLGPGAAAERRLQAVGESLCAAGLSHERVSCEIVAPGNVDSLGPDPVGNLFRTDLAPAKEEGRRHVRH